MLAADMPQECEADTFDYDPSKPTPALGGALLGMHGGPKDNRPLESRPDVLCYTSNLMDKELEIIGLVSVELYVQSSLEYTDFFARLCDVDPDGRSINICDGIVRLSPERFAKSQDGISCVQIELAPTAHCFLPGHRIRLQISSGAHPRFARNLGSGEPLATAVTMKVAHQQVYHDPSHLSSLILPIYKTP
jgi:putative CocE/NonD family hydrolase